jgi:hypothetical protein
LNKIKTDRDKFDFKPPYGTNEFLSIKIDNEWIDKLFERFYPNESIEGTISTLSFRMESEIEEQIVWNRFLPVNNETQITPILMCPDDCDFECLIIVAEIEKKGNKIIWNRIGVDKSKTYQNKQNVGSKVKWLKPTKKFEFELSDYEKVVSDFKIQYEIEKKDYEEYCNSLNK